MDAPAIATGKKKMSSGKKWLIAGIIILVIVAAIFAYSVYSHKKSMASMADEIDKEASEYGDNKDRVSKLIGDACSEIISDRSERKLAKQLASRMNISYEQAVVDMAVGRLRAMRYIA